MSINTSADIRKAFLKFFENKEHRIVSSAPIVVKNDPTLMFTNAGMNQFKDYFLGTKPTPFSRVADTQKCLRVSGKHNDLEEVGVDTYHHTMFEMLGNWSFGNPAQPNAGYFKKEAIAWSWELLTEVYKIPKDRLYVTVFEGDEKEGIPRDEEAATEWSKWIEKDRILLGNKKDNFWEMGDTGPCGPCTEIHVDTRRDEERKRIDGKTLVNADDAEVIEIWNNVFIQFNRLKDGTLQPLPAKHVDTGMGFERLVRVIQNKQSNYDTDIFTGTIEKIAAITNKKYLGDDNKQSVAFRVLADHIRAISFTIADGQLPSNTGAGYVIRRILRRAVRYYYSHLNYQQPLLFQLVPVIANQFADVFPELMQQESFVAKVIKEEEEGFLRTLEKGLKRIEDIIATSNKIISGKNAFELYDTFGFPLDLTTLIASEKKLTVDEEGFNAEMQIQKNRSRAAKVTDAGDWIILQEGNTEFVGYDVLRTTSKILRYRKVKTKGKEIFQLVLDKTPFYAESGGQVGDVGRLEAGSSKYEVTDTKKENDLIIHILEQLPETLEGEIIASVDAEKRKHTAVHHSATHLLHAALQQVLGKHVAQKGSLVNADYLRFDFSHFAKMSNEEILAVEKMVNEKIRENIPVVIRTMPKEEAINSGAMALFGEKYGDTVRVVTMDSKYSIELCGGTHVGNTGELGFLKITSEAAIAAGVRRMEAVSGLAAENYATQQFEQLNSLRELLKNPKDVSKAIQDLMNDRLDLQKTQNQFESLLAKHSVERVLQKMHKINGLKFYSDIVLNVDVAVLKKIYSELNFKNMGDEKAVAFLVGTKDDKVHVLLGSTESFEEFDCNKIIKEKISPVINGGGGGQKILATGTGTNKGAIDLAIEKLKELINTLV